jgi:hypothetical protein
MFSLNDVGFLGSVSTYDADALAYIRAVEIADAQELEAAVRTAINAFVIGCKADGIWTAIKASCILAGARTLSGALVPLVGAAPTNVGPFVSGDYNRETGLAGDGNTKYLNSNRNNNADSQDSQHISIYATTANTGTRWYFGAGVGAAGSTGCNSLSPNNVEFRSRSGTILAPNRANATGLIGVTRSGSTAITTRSNAGNTTHSTLSQSPFVGNLGIFSDPGLVASTAANGRLAFYSIGESLNLALLDARVTTLINDFAAAIP